MNKKTVPVSVVIPTYKRVNDLRNTINKILACDPAPSEIIVHIDFGDNESRIMLNSFFPEIITILSESTQGPGGGRNKGIAIAKNEYVSSFDDDSYPIQVDYFQRLFDTFERIPNAAIVESLIYHPNEPQPKETYVFFRTYLFTGCGVAYRKSWFMKIGGYIPLGVAYGLEEVDFSMRACQFDALFIRTTWLTVFHDTDLNHRFTSKVLTKSITNVGILVFLRYPIIYWPYGLLQVLNKVAWTMKQGRKYKECINGVLKIPFISYSLIKYRKILKLSIIKCFLNKRGITKPFYEFE